MSHFSTERSKVDSGRGEARARLSPDQLDRIEQCRDSFENRLRAGETRDLDHAIAAAPPELRSVLFRELLVLELKYNLPIDVDSERARYHARYPEYSSIVDTVLDPHASPATTIAQGASQPVTARGENSASSPEEYVLGELIGQGGMGFVYRARDLRLDRDVAVKVLHEQFASASAAGRRFADEARITAQLQHPGIPAVHQIGTLGNARPYLAMKLIKGRTLAELLKTKEVINRLGVFESICQAVGYAHAHRVVHRDLKPANIMVGAFGEVQVMDWGLAKVLLDDAEPAEPAAEETVGTQIRSTRDVDEETLAGSVLGTPSYMAPEQAIGAIDQVDERSDVFGLRGILCVLLTGRPPYVSTTVETTRQLAARARLDEVFAELDHCGAEPDLITLCKRCLAAEKADRPANAGEVAQAIATLRSAAEERAKRAELERTRAEVQSHEQRKRRRLALIAGGVVFAVLVFGIAGTTIGLLRAEHRRGEAETAKEKEHEQRQAAETNEKKAREAEEAERRARLDQAAQRLRAEKARDRTREALDAMTSSVTGDSLTTQEEITAEQKKFLTKMLAYYREFAGEKADDEQSRQRIATAAYRLGLIESRLGRTEEAIAAFRVARDGCAALAAEFPDITEYRNALGGNLVVLGEQLHRSGKRSESEQQFRQALVIRQALMAEAPKNPRHRQAMAAIHFNLGYLLADLGKLPNAEEQHRLALSLRRELADEFPDDPSYQKDLAVSHLNLGYLQAGNKLYDDAEAHYQRALEIQTKLMARFPDGRSYLQDVSWTRVNLSMVLRQAGKTTEAEKQVRMALVIQNKLASDFPAVPNLRRDLAVSYNTLGLLLAAGGNRVEAEEVFRLAISIDEKLVAEFPGVPNYQTELGGRYVNFGRLIRDGGNPAESLPWFDKAVATLDSVVKKDPRVVTARNYLRNAYHSRAYSRDQLRHYTDAATDWAKAHEYSSAKEKPWYHARSLLSRLHAGEIAIADALTDIGDVTNTIDWTSNDWYVRGAIYSYASSKVPDKKQEYADRAMELLQKAVHAGYKDVEHMAKDTELEPLRDRADFKKLIGSLPKTAPKGPPGNAKDGK